jgi:hypothetical protein
MQTVLPLIYFLLHSNPTPSPPNLPPPPKPNRRTEIQARAQAPQLISWRNNPSYQDAQCQLHYVHNLHSNNDMLSKLVTEGNRPPSSELTRGSPELVQGSDGQTP